MRSFNVLLLGALAMVGCAGAYRKALPDDATDSVIESARLCDRGEAESCRTLALAWWEGEGVAQDIDQAVPLLADLCGSGHPDLCGVSEEVVLPPDAPPDVVAMARRCDRAEEAACGGLGEVYFNGNGVGQDIDRGVQLFTRACVRTGDAQWCDRVEELRLPDGAPEVAFASARRCDRGEVSACVEVAGFWLQRSDAGSVDHAIGLLSRGCDEGFIGACTSLGRMFMGGSGVVRDIDRGVEYLRVACTAGDVDACGASLELQLVAGASSEAVGSARRCERGDSQGCLELARAWRDGSAGPIESERALGLFEVACGAGVASACTEQADLLRALPESGVEARAAAQLYLDGCEGGDATACMTLGQMHRSGDGAERDVVRAYELLGRACNAGLVAACDDLPGLSEQRLPANAPELARQSARLCDDGDLAACVELAELWSGGRGLVRNPSEVDRLHLVACLGRLPGACEVTRFPTACSESRFDGVVTRQTTFTLDLAELAESGEVDGAPASAAPARHQGLPVATSDEEMPPVDPRAGFTWERAIDANFWASGTTVSHDEVARRVHVVEQDGQTADLEFDRDGRVVRVEEPLGNSTVTTTMTWGQGGRLAGYATAGLGVEGLEALFTYDPTGTLSSARVVRLSIGGVRREQSWTYTYDAAGQIEELVVEEAAVDRAGRASRTGWTQYRWIRDAAGNVRRWDARDSDRRVLESVDYDFGCYAP